nr:unnamed protein product [Callosobruchus analis]
MRYRKCVVQYYGIAAVLAIVVYCVFALVSGVVDTGLMIYRTPTVGQSQVTESSFSISYPSASIRHTTKSLVELGKMDEVNRYFLFLNHVPKCGAEILILLLQRLQGFNNFRHVRLKNGNKRFLTRIQQENLVYEVYDRMKKEAVPLSFDRHVYFINFTSFDRQLPVYINLIRNPVDKVISRTFYKSKSRSKFYEDCLTSNTSTNCNFKNGKPYDLSIPYFCGHYQPCMELNIDWALQIAKSNVEKYYTVVGVLEKLNDTMDVLEQKIPYFFKGAKKIYGQELLGISKNKYVPKVSDVIRKRLIESLAKELEFYDWIKARLQRQLHP